MDQSGPAASELVVPPPPEPGTPVDFVVHVTRIPYDDYFNLTFTVNGREVSEELETPETEKFFLDRMIHASREQYLAREEALGKLLAEAWNFGKTVITIPADVYREPSLPFPQFQPKV